MCPFHYITLFSVHQIWEDGKCEQIRKQTEILSNYITATGPIGEFDKKTFKKTVKRITVSRNKEITFELINGLKLKFEYSEVE